MIITLTYQCYRTCWNYCSPAWMHSIYLWNKQSLWIFSLEIVTSVAPIPSSFYSISTMCFLSGIYLAAILFSAYWPTRVYVVHLEWSSWNLTQELSVTLSSRLIFAVEFHWTHMLLNTTRHLRLNVTPLNGWLANVLPEETDKQVYSWQNFLFTVFCQHTGAHKWVILLAKRPVAMGKRSTINM